MSSWNDVSLWTGFREISCFLPDDAFGLWSKILNRKLDKFSHGQPLSYAYAIIAQNEASLTWICLIASVKNTPQENAIV